MNGRVAKLVRSRSLVAPISSDVQDAAPERGKVTGNNPPRRARLPKGSGASLRLEILAAAERIFISDGYAGASIRKIAGEVGVSSTALYMHFHDKGEILSEIAAKAMGKLIERMEHLLVEQLTNSDRVRAMIAAYLDFALANRNAYQLVFGQSLRLSEVQLAHVDALGQRCYAPFLEAVTALFDEGAVRAATPQIAAQVAWGAAHGVASLQITKPGFPWAAESEVRCQAAVGAMFEGLFGRS